MRKHPFHLISVKIIYANTIWYAAILVGLVNAAFHRHNETDWQGMSDVRSNYDILYGALGLYLVVCIVGLLFKKNWGLSAAIYANAALAFIPLGIFLVSIFLLMPDINFIQILTINLSNLLVGIVSFVFWLWLVKTRAKTKHAQTRGE